MKRLGYSLLLLLSILSCHQNDILAPPTTKGSILRFLSSSYTDGENVYVTKITHSFDQNCRLIQRKKAFYEKNDFLRDYEKTFFTYNKNGLLSTMEIYDNYTPFYGTADQLQNRYTYVYDSKDRIKTIVKNGELEWKFEYDDTQKRIDMYSCFQGRCSISSSLIDGKNPNAIKGSYQSATPDSYYGYWESTFDENGNEILIEQKRVINTEENKALTRITIDYDTRKTPPTEISYADFKGFPAGLFDFGFKRNNRLKETRLTHDGNVLVKHIETIYTYEYNSSGYPTSVVMRTIDKLNNKELRQPTYQRYEYGCLR